MSSTSEGEGLESRDVLGVPDHEKAGMVSAGIGMEPSVALGASDIGHSVNNRSGGIHKIRGKWHVESSSNLAGVSNIGTWKSNKKWIRIAVAVLGAVVVLVMLLSFGSQGKEISDLEFQSAVAQVLDSEQAQKGSEWFPDPVECSLDNLAACEVTPLNNPWCLGSAVSVGVAALYVSIIQIRWHCCLTDEEREQEEIVNNTKNITNAAVKGKKYC